MADPQPAPPVAWVAVSPATGADVGLGVDMLHAALDARARGHVGPLNYRSLDSQEDADAARDALNRGATP